MSPILPTAPRLRFSALSLDDADFIVALLNDPDFRRFIGDRGVREARDVAGYLEAGPLRSYAEHRFGLLKLTERDTGRPIGIAGLIRRPALDDVDLGYALLPGFRRQGYATEACRALVRVALEAFSLPRLVAIVSVENARSIATLERVGFTFERHVRMPGENHDVALYGLALARAAVAGDGRGRASSNDRIEE